MTVQLTFGHFNGRSGYLVKQSDQFGYLVYVEKINQKNTDPEIYECSVWLSEKAFRRT